MNTEISNVHSIINTAPIFQIANCPQLGRYLIAATNIKKGEVILTEQPLVSGPIKGSNSLCPGCYGTPTTNCSACSWPICGSDCPGGKIHQQFECKLCRLKIPSAEFEQEYWGRLSGCLMIVRCLLLKRIDPKKWNSFLEMETNWEQWLGSPLQTTAQYIVQLLRSEYELTEAEFPTPEILKVQAILDINAYEVQLPESNIQAAYKIASLAEHNCIPNIHKSICGDTLELIFRASSDIPKGTHLSTTYCDVLWPTWHRQQYLQWSKFFTCSCERCKSSTELESHLASFVCMICYSSNQQVTASLPLFKSPDNWTNVLKEYICTGCNAQFPAIECQMTFKQAEDELTELDKYASPETIPIFEQWLRKWTVIEDILELVETSEEKPDDRNEIDAEQLEIPKRRKTETCYARTTLLLHPQNSLVLDVCHTLFLLYPKENNGLQQMKRKEFFGAHLLKATKPLFTGISKFRGTISYELAMTKAAILVYQLEQNGLTSNLQHLAEEALQLLSESLDLLKYESLDQPEGKLVETGANQFEQLMSFLLEIFPSLKRYTVKHM